MKDSVFQDESDDRSQSDLRNDGGKVVGHEAKDITFGILSNFTHATMGEPDRPVPCLALVANKEISSWLKDLSSRGYAALLFVNMKSLHDQPGFEESWWFQNRTLVNRSLVKTPLESSATAGIFTMKEKLPSGSLLNSVMCTAERPAAAVASATNARIKDQDSAAAVSLRRYALNSGTGGDPYAESSH